MFALFSCMLGFGQNVSGFQIAFDNAVGCQTLVPADPNNPKRSFYLEEIPETLCVKVYQDT